MDLPNYLNRIIVTCEELKRPIMIEREGYTINLRDGEKVLLTLWPKFCTYEKCNEERFVEITFLKFKSDQMSDKNK